MIGDRRHITALGMLREGKKTKSVARLCNVSLAEAEALAGLSRQEADDFVSTVCKNGSARIGADAEDGADAI
jgi:hypothetical protein